MSRIFQALERAEREGIFLRQRNGKENGTRVPSESKAQRFSASLIDQISVPQKRQGDEFDQSLVAETLGSIDAHLVGLLASTTPEAEQYRTICHGLEQLTKETGLSVLAVSSPAVGDGKTTTAINLAGTLGQSPGIRVLLVDLDLRRPSISQALRVTHVNSSGVIGIISDPNLSWRSAVQCYSAVNLHVLPAGTSSTAPHELLKSQRLGEFLQEARHCYDYVIIDTPPLIPFSDCQILQRWIDGFLLVVAAHKTPRELIEEAIQSVVPTKMLGLIYNNDTLPVYKYYSYYRYGPPHVEERLGWLRWVAKKIGSLFQRSSR